MTTAPKSELSDRLRRFRESLRLTQAQMAVALGGSTPGYKNNEQGLALPNTKMLIALREQGLNVDWLLSGEGPMLRAELERRVAPKINEEALIKAFEVMVQTAKPDETPRQTARKAVEFYMYLIEKGMITPEGVGDGNQSSAA